MRESTRLCDAKHLRALPESIRSKLQKPLRLQGTYKQQDMEHLIAESLAVPLGNGGQPPVSVLAATYYRSRYKGEL